MNQRSSFRGTVLPVVLDSDEVLQKCQIFPYLGWEMGTVIPDGGSTASMQGYLFKAMRPARLATPYLVYTGA